MNAPREKILAVGRDGLQHDAEVSRSSPAPVPLTREEKLERALRDFVTQARTATDADEPVDYEHIENAAWALRP